MTAGATAPAAASSVRGCVALAAASGFLLILASADVGLAQSRRAPAETRSIALELYVPGDAEGEVQARVEAATKERPGVGLRVYKLSDDDAAGRERFDKICAHYKLKPDESVPLVYGFNKAFVAPDDAASLERQLDSLRTMTVFVRAGCPRCAAAKTYLKKLQAKYPGILVNYRDVATDRTAQTELDQVSRRYNQRAVSVPVFHFCNQITVGWAGESGTGSRLEGALSRWTFPVKPAAAPSGARRERPVDSRRSATVSLTGALPSTRHVNSPRLAAISPAPLLALFTMFPQAPEHGERDPPADEPTPENFPAAADPAAAPASQDSLSDAPADASALPTESFDSLPLPGDVSDSLPLPGDVGDSGTSEFDVVPSDAIDVPWLGRLRASNLGMPLLTIAVGLVDGFNPCAMWVLMFLLSVLVNLNSRWKILAVAGTFVVISGLAYFVFMAFMFNINSYIREKQESALYIVLGVLAVLISIVHIKDFFAFKEGFSLSIPEAAKPGIYARVRRIVTAENLVGAIAGAAVLAVIINLIELLCTAGLPALYTGVLATQEYPAWKEYAYIGLYNLAYMFDDSLMVGLVVITLGKRKLQEKQGRWLKLVSGVAILLLGLVMLLKPELLKLL